MLPTLRFHDLDFRNREDPAILRLYFHTNCFLPSYVRADFTNQVVSRLDESNFTLRTPLFELEQR